MKNLIIFSVVILSLTGCYQFKTPPFSDKDLKPIGETEFGKEFLKAIGGVNTDKDSPISEMKENISSDTKVLVIADDFLVGQNKKKGSEGWELTTMMKNSTHVLLCILGENKTVQIPQSLQVTEKKEMMGPVLTVGGPRDELKKFALELIETSGPICLGVPHKS